ncbi:unnamed protein product [Cochlearia groenlandica]
MPRHREEDDDVEEEYEEEEEEERGSRGGGGSRKKRGRSEVFDDDEDYDDYEEEDDDEDEDYGSTSRRGGGKWAKRKKPSASMFVIQEAVQVDDEDEEEDEVDGEDDFIEDGGTDLPGERGDRRYHDRGFLSREENDEDVEDIVRKIKARHSRNHEEYDDEEEEATDVEQQAFLPSVRDPKLWMVKCAIGREREVAVCLMQKFIDRGSDLQIRSVVAPDHLKNFIYVEADKESHVKEAIKGMRNIYANQKILLVPIREMTDVLSVESKAIDLSRDTWVRMKLGTYKGDLAKVVDVDNVRQRVKVKLIPRIDLQALASKLDGREVAKKKAFVPPPRFMNIDEAREMHIRVERRRDPMTGDYFENIGGMLFKDGFLYKQVSLKSITAQNVTPTFDELEKFNKPSENGESDIGGLSTLFANRKKGHFMKGDAVIVIKGDLKNLKGWVEKVDEENVFIRSEMKGLPDPLTVIARELCKYFEPGNHVKIISGTHEGTTGMVVKVDQHVLIILSDTSKEHVRVFADHVVESSEVITGVTKIGEFELHDLVLLDNLSFGVIIRLEKEAFQVLKGIPGRPEVALVKRREIKSKLAKKINVQDCYKNVLSVNDDVRVINGPSKGNQGPVKHIYKGVLFIYDRHHLEHAGFICAKSTSCIAVGGSHAGSNRNGGDSLSRFSNFKAPAPVSHSPRRFQHGGMGYNGGGRHRGGREEKQDCLLGTTVKIRLGPFKGYRGPIVEVKGNSVRVELEMKIVTVDRDAISDNMNATKPSRDSSRYSMGSETPMHPSRTPLRPCMTPMRDSGATPIHDGMRTPMRDRAWNPYTPMSPPRDNWEDGNPGSWGTSPQYQPGSPPLRAYEAPTPCSGWASTPGNSYSDAGTPRDFGSAYGKTHAIFIKTLTVVAWLVLFSHLPCFAANAPNPYLPSTPGQPMTPSSTSYLPGTPGGQPMTPGTGLDFMSPPVIGGDAEAWFMPDILVEVHKAGEDSHVGVVRDVSDGTCKVSLGSSGEGESIMAVSSELEIVTPRKNDRVKIVGGQNRGSIGKLIGIDGSDGIVKIEENLEVKILDLAILGKLVQT